MHGYSFTIPYIITIRYSDFSNEDKERCILLLNAVGINISKDNIEKICKYTSFKIHDMSFDVHVLTRTIEFNFMVIGYNKAIIIDSKGRRILIETFAEFLKILNFIKDPEHDTFLQYINNNNI